MRIALAVFRGSVVVSSSVAVVMGWDLVRGSAYPLLSGATLVLSAATAVAASYGLVRVSGLEVD